MERGRGGDRDEPRSNEVPPAGVGWMMTRAAQDPNDKGGDNAEGWLRDHTAGTGPYTLEKWEPNIIHVARKNPGYWRGWPAAKFTKFFNTGLIQPGQAKFIVAPKQPGGYPFFCQVHHFMTGMMVVGNSSASAAALAAFRAALRARSPSYCGRQHATATAVAARRAPAGRLASGG